MIQLLKFKIDFDQLLSQFEHFACKLQGKLAALTIFDNYNL